MLQRFVCTILFQNDDDDFDFDPVPVENKPKAENAETCRAAMYATPDTPADTEKTQPLPPTIENVSDVDVTLSFKEPVEQKATESSKKDNDLSNILTGLQNTPQKNVDDEFDFDVNEAKEDRLDDVNLAAQQKEKVSYLTNNVKELCMCHQDVYISPRIVTVRKNLYPKMKV